MVFVDGVDIGDPADVALRDRRMLSDDGIFIVVATISEQTGESVVPPEVIFRGVPFIEQADGLVAEIREEVERALTRAVAEGSVRSTCSSRSSTTSSRRLSTTVCAVGRWCCRSSSRCRLGAAAACGGSAPARSSSAGPTARLALAAGARPRTRPVARVVSVTDPPWDSATARTIASPRPDPLAPSPPPRTKRSNTRSLSSGGIPGRHPRRRAHMRRRRSTSRR